MSAPHPAGPADPRIFCFERDEEDREFETSIAALMNAMQQQSRKMFIDDHNVLRMNHGASWVHSARESEAETRMHTISAEWTIPFAAIADNDLGLIARTILPINKQMERQFAQNIYGMVSDGARKVGNVVDARETGSISQAILEMFRKIEFGVDRDGNVSMPQMHVGPDLHARLVKEMENVPAEITAAIEHVKAEKIQLALDREAERKARFKRAAS